MKNTPKIFQDPTNSLVTGKSRYLIQGLNPIADLRRDVPRTNGQIGDAIIKTPQIDTSGTEAAQKAVADAQTAANNLQKNFQTDLSTENLTQVVPGGDAMDSLAGGSTLRKKRGTGSGLSSALGVY